MRRILLHSCHIFVDKFNSMDVTGEITFRVLTFSVQLLLMAKGVRVAWVIGGKSGVKHKGW